jgi:hypothetical protein
MIKQFTWDWQEQPPLDDIAAETEAMSAKGKVWIYRPETGTDSYALLLSPRALTIEQVQKVYDEPDAQVRVRVSIETPAGPVVEFFEMDLAELIGLTEAKRSETVTEAAADVVNNICSWGVEEVDGEDEDE